MRQQYDRRADAVAVAMRREAADQIQEAMQLARALMEHSGARPTVRPAEDRAIAVLGDDAFQFVGGTVERFVPRQCDEFVAAAIARWSGSAIEPTAPRDRRRDARRMSQAARQIAEQRRRIGIV